MVKETCYPIEGADGKLICEHIRRDLEDGDKKFSWRVPGKEREGLHGIRRDSLPLFALRRLISAPKDRPVIVVEGERKAEILQKRAGEIAVVVATVTGAGGRPSNESLMPLVGRFVYLWPDHDTKGREHMERIAQVLNLLGDNTNE